jgi:hypothetical protein
VRRREQTTQLVVASDSRLRSRGAIDQCQKIFRLDRGDSCLGFCGDSQFSYPLFIQVGTTLNNHIKTRTRALDVTQIGSLIQRLLNNLLEIWDLDPAEKVEELAKTKILFGGWSASLQRFYVGHFEFKGGQFSFNRSTVSLGHPWRERGKSLIFLGDYEADYLVELKSIMNERYSNSGIGKAKVVFDFDYEPVEALHAILSKADTRAARTAIGGAPQLLKIYNFGNTLPFVVRTTPSSHYLLGRRLFPWEKTEHPVLDLCAAPAKVLYPMLNIPLPADLLPDSDDDPAGSA